MAWHRAASRVPPDRPALPAPQLNSHPQAHRMPCRTASSPSLDLLDLLPLRGSCPSSGISFGWFCLSLSKVSFKSIALREGVAVVAGGGLVTSLVTDRSLFQVGPHLWCWQRRPLAHGHRSKAPSGSSSQVMRSRSRLAGSWQSSPSTGRGVHTGNNRPRTGRESPLRARHQAGRHQEKGQRNGVRPPPSTVNPKVEVRTEDMEW